MSRIITYKRFARFFSNENLIRGCRKFTSKTGKETEIGSPYQDLKLITYEIAKENDDSKTLRFVDVNRILDNKEWVRRGGDKLAASRANYYELHSDLFDHVVPLYHINIRYTGPESVVVKYGNILRPEDCPSEPCIKFQDKSVIDQNSLYSLILLSPDDNVFEQSAETIRYMINNIPGAEISQGIETCAYIPPTPPKEFGLLRYVYLWCKQVKPLEVGKNDIKPYTTFNTKEFLSKNALTVESYCFHQCEWDASVTKSFETHLGMPEPIYELKEVEKAPRKLKNYTKHGPLKHRKYL